jgi:acyl-CoA synthetase (NDP forming)
MQQSISPASGLRPLLEPRSIAIVGVSAAGNRATLAFRNLEEQGYDGEIYLVNPKYRELYGRPCYPSLASIPADVDCAFLSIPAPGVIPTLQEAAAAGIPAAVVISSGFGEGDGTGREKAAALKELATASGIKVCGPNCLGIITPTNRSSAYGYTLPGGLQAGRVSGVFQSGAAMGAVVGELSRRGVGFRIAVSSGNEAIVDNSEYIEYFVEDSGTEVIVAFIEGIQDHQRFRRAAELARAKGKPIILIKIGRSPLGAKAALAHTGSVAGPDIAAEELFAETGVIRCHDFEELIETTVLVSIGRIPAGTGVACVTISGGEAGLYLDMNNIDGLGVSLPELSPATAATLREILPRFASVGNPLDATGAVALDTGLYKEVVRALLADERISVIAISDSVNERSPATKTVVEVLSAWTAKTEKCILLFTPNFGSNDGQLGAKLAGQGIPLLRGARAALAAIGNLTRFAKGRLAADSCDKRLVAT